MSSVRFGFHANNLGFGFGYNQNDNRTEFGSVIQTEPMLGSVKRNDTGSAYLNQEILIFVLVSSSRHSSSSTFSFKVLTFKKLRPINPFWDKHQSLCVTFGMFKNLKIEIPTFGIRGGGWLGKILDLHPPAVSSPVARKSPLICWIEGAAPPKKKS